MAVANSRRKLAPLTSNSRGYSQHTVPCSSLTGLRFAFAVLVNFGALRNPRWRWHLPASRDHNGVVQSCPALTVFFHDLDPSDLRSRHRQRRLTADRGNVDLAREQHDKTAGMADATGDAAGCLARAPIQISTRRSNDGGSGILRDHQTAEGRRRLAALDRQLGFNKERRAILVRAVDGNGAARRQRHALRAERLALVGEVGYAEEHV